MIDNEHQKNADARRNETMTVISHTPTDDEREALLAELSAWQKHTGDAALGGMLRRTASAIRRYEGQLAAMTAEKETWRIRCAEETIAWASEASENRRLLSAESQGEPSDAAVQVAFDIIRKHRGGTGLMAAVRDALRAASAVTEQGENRDD